MTWEALQPYLTGPMLGFGAVALARFLRALARHMLARAKRSSDTSDDIIAARWLSRAETLNDVTDFVVRWFVPSALAPKPVSTPSLDREEREAEDDGPS